jgi:hypothetical protein
MDDESYFTVDSNEWQQQIYSESEDHLTTEYVTFVTRFLIPEKNCISNFVFAVKLFILLTHLNSPYRSIVLKIDVCCFLIIDFLMIS